MAAEHYRAERMEVAEAQAEEIIAAELKRRGWGAGEFSRRVKEEAVKVALAARLRTETVMTVRWVAERLRTGAPGYVNHFVYRRWKAGKDKACNDPLFIVLLMFIVRVSPPSSWY